MNVQLVETIDEHKIIEVEDFSCVVPDDKSFDFMKSVKKAKKVTAKWLLQQGAVSVTHLPTQRVSA